MKAFQAGYGDPIIGKEVGYHCKTAYEAAKWGVDFIDRANEHYGLALDWKFANPPLKVGNAYSFAAANLKGTLLMFYVCVRVVEVPDETDMIPELPDNYLSGAERQIASKVARLIETDMTTKRRGVS